MGQGQQDTEGKVGSVDLLGYFVTILIVGLPLAAYLCLNFAHLPWWSRYLAWSRITPVRRAATNAAENVILLSAGFALYWGASQLHLAWPPFEEPKRLIFPLIVVLITSSIPRGFFDNRAPEVSTDWLTWDLKAPTDKSPAP